LSYSRKGTLSFGMAQARGRSAKMTTKDALALAVIVLVAFVLVEGLVLYNADPAPKTRTQTFVETSISSLTATYLQTLTTSSGYTLTSTSTQTSTVTSGVTTTSTTTVTATSVTTVMNHGPFVVIPLGSGANRSSTGFSPPTVVVYLGVNNTVTWINEDNVTHTVTSLSVLEPFNSGSLAQGGTFSFTFTVSGNFSYTDAYHSWEKGVVLVKP
jgi:plastocyanin